MLTVGNLLHMERCASCQRELAAHWKFCIYCGRPFIVAPQDTPHTVFADSGDERAESRRNKFDSGFWVGVGIGVLGLILIVYAAVQIYGTRA